MDRPNLLRVQLPPPLLAIAIAMLLLALAAYAEPPAAAAGCASCHEEQVNAMKVGPHATAIARNDRFCTSCHGEGTKHKESGDAADIRGGAQLAKWTAQQQAAACASCHSKDFPSWQQSAHAGQALCWSCHASEALHHAPEQTLVRARSRGTYELCTSCHRDAAAEFRMLYRHPVEKGIVDCTSCHDIHGKEVQPAGSVTESACLRCHDEQNGPFLFTHAGTEQGCSSCHARHGSPHRGQLKSAGNGICLSCHLQSNFPGIASKAHDFRLSGGGRCWDCHSDVHGSNTTPDLNPRGRR